MTSRVLTGDEPRLRGKRGISSKKCLRNLSSRRVELNRRLSRLTDSSTRLVDRSIVVVPLPCFGNMSVANTISLAPARYEDREGDWVWKLTAIPAPQAVNHEVIFILLSIDNDIVDVNMSVRSSERRRTTFQFKPLEPPLEGIVRASSPQGWFNFDHLRCIGIIEVSATGDPGRRAVPLPTQLMVVEERRRCSVLDHLVAS